MNRDIPGYWFCPVKKKYFKEEASHTAPADSFYNATNIMKLRVQQDKADKSSKYQMLTKDLIKRAPIMSDPMTGGRFLSHLGFHDPELPNKCWLTGLQDKGEVALGPRGGPSMDCMLVNCDDTQSGLAMIYAAMHGDTQIQTCYVPTNQDDTIDFNADPLLRPSRRYQLRPELFYFEDITSITKFKSKPRLLQTSRAYGTNTGRITIFEPRSLTDRDVRSIHHPFWREPAPRPCWVLGDTDTLLDFAVPCADAALRTSCLLPDQPLHVVVATSRGVLSLTNDRLCWLGPNGPGRPRRHDAPLDVLAVAHHPTSPHLVYAGDRSGVFGQLDLRVAHSSSSGDGSSSAAAGGGGGGSGGGWTAHRHRSAVAHLRCLGDFQVLAAGPESAMDIYDVRRLAPARGRGSGGRNNSRAPPAAAPVCTMHGYVNSAHTRIGLDIATLHGGEAVVAAAGSDGTVGMYSLRTGHKLRANALDRLALGAGEVAKCLQWETMPGEKDPSLWVSVGNKVKKFSFGRDEGEDELL